MTITPNLSQVLKQSVLYHLNDTHTSMVGEVTKYDATKNTVDVQPVIRARFTDGTTEQVPIVSNVPIAYPQGAGFSIRFPMSVGDFVMLVFAERALDEWKSEGGSNVEAQSRRRFDMSDAVAIPGVVPNNNATSAPTDKLVIQKENTVVEISDGLIKLDTNGSRVEIDGSEVYIGKAGSELLDLLDQTLQEIITLSSSFTDTSLGPKLLTNGPSVGIAVAAIKTKLGFIKS